MMPSNQIRRVLVTGANGFVGKRLCEYLLQQRYQVVGAVRSHESTMRLQSEGRSKQPTLKVVGDLLQFEDWSRLLRGIDAVVHLVARTHVVDEFGLSAMRAYRQINVELTKRLANAAQAASVSRFVYLSSIKAVGNGSQHAYTEQEECNPEDSYGISKLEAEQELGNMLRESSCDFVVLRPPLVYGPGVQGNFLRLMKLVDRGVPLPRVENARSMVHVDNLTDVIERCLRSSRASNRCFHVADPHPISTTELVQSMAIGLGRPARSIPTPRFLLEGFGRVLGKQQQIRRVTGSLTVSTDSLMHELDWESKLETREGVIATCQAYRRQPWSDRTKAEVQPLQTHERKAA